MFDFFGSHLEFAWVVGGVILILLEFLLPGAFVIFLGIGAVVAGILTRVFDLSLSFQILSFVVTTLVSVLLGGTLVKKLFRSESSVDPYIKDDFLDQIVSVEEEILVNQLGGKVRFQGTVWDAVSNSGKIPKGSKVKIKSRDNLTFTVEPLLLEFQSESP